MRPTRPVVKSRAAARAAVHIRARSGLESLSGCGAGRVSTGHGVASNSVASGVSSSTCGTPLATGSVSDVASSMLVDAIIPPSPPAALAQQSNLSWSRPYAEHRRNRGCRFGLRGDGVGESLSIGLRGRAQAAVGATSRLLDQEDCPRVEE